MSIEPLVSVVVPAWNSERTLRETLQSAAAQTYSNLEIIIIDDGSTDGTAAVAEEFCGAEPRARLIRTGNRGVSRARNRGIAEALGEWIAPIDSDDVWHPTKIEKQLRVALADSGPVGFAYCWYRQIDEGGRLLASGPRLRLTGRVFHQLAYMNPVENGSAPLFARNALVRVGGYDDDLPPYEDPMVQLRVASEYSVALVPEHLVGWRRHAFNASNDAEIILTRARQMYERLLAEGAGLPAQVGRWALARNALDAAEQSARSGNLLAGCKSLVEAFGGDPTRTTLQLIFRAARSAKKRLTGRSPPPIHPLFADVDPAAEIGMDTVAVPALAAWLERLDERRLARLAELDSSRRGKLARKLSSADIADPEAGEGEQI